MVGNQNEAVRVSPKVIERTAKGWGRLSDPERTELKAKLPLDDLYPAIVAACVDMSKSLLRANDESEKSILQDKRKRLEFLESRLEVETNENLKRDLYLKIDKIDVDMTLIYDKSRKDRNKKYWGNLTLGAAALAATVVALAQKKRS